MTSLLTYIPSGLPVSKCRLYPSRFSFSSPEASIFSMRLAERLIFLLLFPVLKVRTDNGARSPVCLRDPPLICRF